MENPIIFLLVIFIPLVCLIPLFRVEKTKKRKDDCQDKAVTESSNLMWDVDAGKRKKQEKFKKAIDEYEKIISGFSYKYFDIGLYERVYVVEEEFVAYISIDNRVCAEQNNPSFTRIFVEEMTYNYLYKFNATAYGEIFENSFYELQVARFYGYEQKCIWDKINCTKFFYVNEQLPELNLVEKAKKWEGLPYHFLVVELYDDEGTAATVKCLTNGNVEREAEAFCRRIEQFNLNVNFNSKLNNSDIYDKLRVMKTNFLKNKKIWSLKGHLRYFYISEMHVNFDLDNRCKQILDDYNDGQIENIEWHDFGRFERKWKSEFLVFEMCKKIYGADNVVFQYRPFFLGTQSYDVYISSKKTAIEYQGKQHFEPVDFFGGQENYKRQILRDERKKELSIKNRVKLVYINYDEIITETLIRERVEGK